MKLYHVSNVEGLKVIKPFMSIKKSPEKYGDFFKKFVNSKTHYACFAVNPHHAFWWSEVLYGRNSVRNSEKVVIYEVEVDDKMWVEFFPGYHFEGQGEIMTVEAEERSFYEMFNEINFDCEINLFDPVEVTGIYAELQFNKK